MSLPASLTKDIINGGVYDDEVLKPLYKAIEAPRFAFIGPPLIVGENLENYNKEIRSYGLAVIAFSLLKIDGRRMDFPLYLREETE
jgi:hypothetical protein